MCDKLKKHPERIVCIHQPDFFPWMGFFDKVIRSDVFILLDHVQFPKTGGTYCNRVKLLLNGRDSWVTAPIDRNYSGFKTITEVEFKSNIPWREKMLKSISINYCRAPFFRESLKMIEPLILNPEKNISLYNLGAILTISENLGISVKKFVRSSELNHHGASTELLVSLTESVGGSSYMAGSGAAGYQVDSLFANANIDVIHRQYKQPIYTQVPEVEFIGGLSIIDALMYCGLSGVRLMINKGID